MESPTLIKYNSLTFLLSGAPDEYHSTWYISTFKSHNVKHIVCVSELTYDPKKYEMNGFIVHNLAFEDGSFPRKHIIKAWELIVEDAQRTNTTIMVHCVAGLGRAPVMIALSLMKAGMAPNGAIEYIRNHRRGCFNGMQIRSLQNYKNSNNSCIVM